MKIKERGNSYLRFFDRYVGIPLVCFLGLFKRKKKFPKHIHSIALLKAAGIGDLVILSAIISDLQKSFVNSRITLYTGKSNAEMAQLIPGVEVISLPMTSPLKCIKKVRKRKHTIWIDCDPWPRINALLSYFSHAEYTLGFRSKGQHRHFLFDRSLIHSFECHEIENYRKFVSALGVFSISKPQLSFPDKPIQKKIALHLFSGGSRALLKQWEIEKWKKLVEVLVKEGFEIFFTGGSSEKDKLEKLKKECGENRVENCAGRLNLKETISLLNECCCLISVDTGIMHLAAALGCHVVALHGPTSPKRWGAIGDNVTVIAPEFAYQPCIQLGFENVCKNNTCMKSITVDRVLQAVYQITRTKNYERGDSCRREGDTALATFSKPLSKTVSKNRRERVFPSKDNQKKLNLLK